MALAYTESLIAVDWKPFLQMITTLTGAEAAVMRARNLAGDTFPLVAAVGLDEALIDFEKRSPPCGVCAQTLRDDAIYAESRNCQLTQRVSASCAFQRVISVPLDYQNQPVGVLNLFFRTNTPETYETLLKPIGLLLGLALENQRLQLERAQLWNLRMQHLLAAELHDGIAQQLSFSRMSLHVARQLAQNLAHTQGIEGLEQLKERLDELEKLIGAVHREVRHLIEVFGSDEHQAIKRDWSAAFAEFRTACPECELQIALDPQALPSSPVVLEQLTRIVQEALHNVHKHAAARHVAVTLTRDDEQLILTIQDDGRGIAPQNHPDEKKNSSYGLKLMQERVTLMGGRWSFSSQPGLGTTIRIAVPLHIAFG